MEIIQLALVTGAVFATAVGLVGVYLTLSVVLRIRGGVCDYCGSRLANVLGGCDGVGGVRSPIPRIRCAGVTVNFNPR